ncbi:elongation factor P [bacterium]|jgi:elongation factor P|nr:elongation factor P [bacterium]
MIATSDFRKGVRILFRGDPWIIVDFAHVKPGKGGAFVRTKLRNLRTANILDETFRSGEKFEAPDLDQKPMQYLYCDDDLCHFMDQESFEQESFDESQLSQVGKYLKEGIIYTVLSFEGKPISIEAPTFMELKVVETVPGVKGNTAQGGSKLAKLETGLTVQVPLFINEGEIIKVDTRDGGYIERV